MRIRVRLLVSYVTIAVGCVLVAAVVLLPWGERGGIPLRLTIALVLVVAAALALGALVARTLSEPLDDLRRAAGSVAGGDVTARARIRTGDELQELGDSLDAATARLAERIAAATAERSRLEGVLEAMVEGVIVTSPDGRVARANAAVRRLFQVGGPLEGRTALEALRHPDAADALTEAARASAPVAREFHLTWPEQRTISLQAVGLPSGGAVGVFRDVTERRRLDAVRRDFVANVSHELKTPLATLAGYAEELSTPGLAAGDVQRSAEVIGRHVSRMSALVDDLLALARLEASGFAPTLEPMDAAALVLEAVREWEPRATAREIRLHARTEGPITVSADARLVRRALDNLIDNAIRHCPSGTNVRISARPLDGGVELVVADDGPGIPISDQGRIFERFYRVEKGRGRETGGTGLGLAIVKHVAEAHGGRASLESRPGAGSTFRVTLPA